MSHSEYGDFSSGALDQQEDAALPARTWRRRPRPLTFVLLVALVGLPLLAAWVHLGRVHESDLEAFAALREDLALVDENLPALSHGDSPPCASSDDEGVATRGYSPETGPTPAQVLDQLRLVGYWPAPAAPGALLSFDQTVDGHRLTVDVLGPASAGQGLRLRATSSATSLACLLR